jgi:hypothetical protein
MYFLLLNQINAHTTHTFFSLQPVLAPLCMLYVYLVGLVKENKLIKVRGISSFKIKMLVTACH